jgi:hypothetical protein
VQAAGNIVVQVDANGAVGGANFQDVAILNGYGTSGADIVRMVFEGTDHVMSV